MVLTRIRFASDGRLRGCMLLLIVGTSMEPDGFYMIKVEPGNYSPALLKPFHIVCSKKRGRRL